MKTVLKLILTRIALAFLTLFLVSLVIFFAIELLPGDAAQQLLGQSATPETLAALRLQLGLDQPLMIRYCHWLFAAFHGDFGTSFANQRAVSELIGSRIGNTMFLAIYAAVLAIPVAVLLGVLAALWRNGIFDRIMSIASLTTISFPEFFIAYILILFLSVKVAWFPSLATVSPSDGFLTRLYICFLPAATLMLCVNAHIMRMTRASLVSLLSSPYIETAVIKGIRPINVIIKHALPNALAPIINIITFNLAYLVAGVVVVEVVFVYPGLGQLMVDSVTKRDIAVVQACCLIFAAIYIGLNMLADILSIVTNPRLLHPR